MDNSLDELSKFFLEPAKLPKRQECRPGGLKILGDMKKNTSKPQPHAHQNKPSEDSPCTDKSPIAQTAVVNKQKQVMRPSSTSLDSDSVKSLILKLNTAKQKQSKARTKPILPNVAKNKIPFLSEKKAPDNCTSILEQLFMSSKNFDLGHKQRNEVKIPYGTLNAAITASNKVVPSSTKPLALSKSKDPPLVATQNPPLTASLQTSAESYVTSKILDTTSPGVTTTSLEEWFLSKNTAPIPPVVSRRRSAEEARSTTQAPAISSNVAESPAGGSPHQTPSPKKPGKSPTMNGSASEGPTSQPLSKETPKSPIVLTIRRLGTIDKKTVEPKLWSVEQGRSGPQALLQGNKKSPNSKTIETKGKRKFHPEHLENKRSSERYQPSRKSKRIPFRNASNTNVDNAGDHGDNLQTGKPLRQTPKLKKRPKKNSGSSVISKKQVLNKHSRSTQKTKRNHKKGLKNIEGQSNKTPGKYSQCNVDPNLKSTKKKTTIDDTSKKNSNQHPQRRLDKSTKKGNSKTSLPTKRAACRKDSDSESRKRLRKSSAKSNKVASDEDDSKLEKSHSSGGTIFTLSELEHACNTLLPVSEIQQLEDRLHSGPVKSSRVPVSHSGLGSIFDARIHPGGIWKSIIDEG